MLPDRALYDYELIKYAKMLKIQHFIGVFPRDKLPARPRRTERAIINLDTGAGTHWAAYCKKGRRVNYYDSFGNLPPPLELQSYLNGCEITYNYTRYQKYNTTNCGRLCLEFLTSCRSR